MISSNCPQEFDIFREIGNITSHYLSTLLTSSLMSSTEGGVSGEKGSPYDFR
jgi:hypothetical protein